MSAFDGGDPFGDIKTAQGLAQQSVTGYGNSLQPQLRRTIGTTLGGLNAIGGLRSGAVPQALNDISTDYGNQIGAYADQATLSAMNTGLGANQAKQSYAMQQFYQDQIRRQQQGGVLSAIGGVLGAGIGFAVGGPAGAGAGYGAGKSAFGNGGYSGALAGTGVGVTNGYTGGY